MKAQRGNDTQQLLVGMSGHLSRGTDRLTEEKDWQLTLTSLNSIEAEKEDLHK